MARAKVLHLAARTFLAYNQIMELDSASSPLNRYFAHSATLRDRVFMYLVCLIPPDRPIELPDFLTGATHAANVWRAKLDKQRQALELPVGTTFKLEKLQVNDARLAEAQYEYADAAVDHKDETCSIYLMNEALSMTVRFAVTEHLLAFRSEGDDQPTRHTLKTSFDWSFYSDVSRENLVDWRITKATPFKLDLAVDKQVMKTKVPAAV
ncbi:hypothetical protein PHYSODRAFT_531795 [Phytophthora sojae]|uniref:Uncharacterized protein n=1 Tax=Phytophthora sojae (strain P6497) TaxID=1094619 RepID=G5AE94_PHYSP|nr:hypothetical protein PHYSODRAFT_531795 [Phytophthora sojae]EGZ06496.1 hypothetical protein PHYSODRAFT_531795 [Phytophthora sojae]|eukprot:XP_009538393.1 hypothetical protein PHYSODRAFT_531795 [Phytophthora sojae]